MAEYIDREEAINAISIVHGELIEIGEVVDILDEMSAADVQPVKHGRWIDKNPQDKYDPRCICSVCGSVEFPLSRHKYCPNCGADMRGE